MSMEVGAVWLRARWSGGAGAGAGADAIRQSWRATGLIVKGAGRSLATFTATGSIGRIKRSLSIHTFDGRINATNYYVLHHATDKY